MESDSDSQKDDKELPLKDMILKKASRFANTSIQPAALPKKSDSQYFFPNRMKKNETENNKMKFITELIDSLPDTVPAKTKVKLPMILELR